MRGAITATLTPRLAKYDSIPVLRSVQSRLSTIPSWSSPQYRSVSRSAVCCYSSIVQDPSPTTDESSVKTDKSDDDDTATTEERTIHSISDSSYNTKHRRSQFTPEIDAEIVRLREQGYSWTAIGSVLGMPHRSCHRRYITTLDPNLQQDVWPEEKFRELERMVTQGKTWAEIAVALGTTVVNCTTKWNMTVRPAGEARKRTFDTVQSRVLLKMVEEHGEHDWKAVMRGFMSQLGSRTMAKVTPEHLKHQYYRLQRLSSRVWSHQEETALIQHVLKHGTGHWEEISQALPSHSPEDCRERWIALDMKARIPKEKRWYRAEKSNFWRFWLRCGDDWAKIASYFPKRSPEQCQAFFEKATAGFKEESSGNEDYDREAFHEKVTKLAKSYTNYVTIHWKKEESDRLWDVADKVREESEDGRIIWSIVAERMNMGLEAAQYKHHHYYLSSVKKGGLAGTWTEDEIRTLERAVQEVGRDWVRVSKDYLPHRNPKSVCHKFSTIKSKGFHISPEEYDALMSQIDLQEERFREVVGNDDVKFMPDWRKISKGMPGGIWTPSQCETAYESSFKNHIRNSHWTPKEDEELLKAVQLQGRKNWVGIAQLLPGRGNWECRMRWSQLHDPVLEDKESAALLTRKLKKNALLQEATNSTKAH